MTSFRLQKNSMKSGDVTTLLVEGIATPSKVLGKRCKIQFFANESALLAEFDATISGSPGNYTWKSVTRTDSLEHELPESGPRLMHGVTPPTEYSDQATWHQPHFKLKLGASPAFTLVVPPEAKEKTPLCYVYLISFRVEVLGSIFDSTKHPGSLVCIEILASNCAEWTRCLRTNHNERLVESNDKRGTHFGSYSEQKGIRKLKKDGFKVTSCIGYVLDTLEKGHSELRASELWKSIREEYIDGYKNIVDRSGIGLVRGLVQKAGWTSVLISPKKEAKGAHRMSKDASTYWYAELAEFIGTDDLHRGEKLDALATVAFGVVNLNGGNHTGLLVGGRFCEVHWRKQVDSDEVFDNERSLESADHFDANFDGDLVLVTLPPTVWAYARGRAGL